PGLCGGAPPRAPKPARPATGPLPPFVEGRPVRRRLLPAKDEGIEAPPRFNPCGSCHKMRRLDPMSQRETIDPTRNAPLFAWLGVFARLAEAGTAGYPRPVRRRLAIINLMAFLIAVFSAVYAAVFALHGMNYWP